MKKIKKTYAKINLHLEILNKREDLYHNIFGVFALINFFDILKLEKFDVFDSDKSNIEVEIINSGGIYNNLSKKIPDSENLITKATKLILNKSKKSGNIKFSLTKNIPAGAGLGGGSSNAAMALELLNEHITNLDKKNLIKIGAKLGADIPFFLSNNKFSICEGTGEIIKNIETKLNYWILVLNNGIHVDTGKAYNLLNRNNNFIYNKNKIIEKKGLIEESLTKGNLEIIKKLFKNDFERVIFKLHPELSEIKEKLSKLKAFYTTMTGSGSTIIALFNKKDLAIKAQKFFEKKLEFVYLTNFI